MSNSHLPRPETAEQALEMLKQGNARFVENVQNPQSTLLASNALTHVHEPFAIILGVLMRACRLRLSLIKGWVIYSSFV